MTQTKLQPIYPYWYACLLLHNIIITQKDGVYWMYMDRHPDKLLSGLKCWNEECFFYIYFSKIIRKHCIAAVIILLKHGKSISEDEKWW